jgi:IS1 family transposase
LLSRRLTLYIRTNLSTARPAKNAILRQSPFHVGDRSRTSAKQLWAKIPQAYRQHATFYTDQYVVYAGMIPAAQHKAISRLARTTNHIERFNNTLRQRVSRLVREALSFSKKLANHIGAIKLFICHYNLRRVAAASRQHYLCSTTQLPGCDAYSLPQRMAEQAERYTTSASRF